MQIVMLLEIVIKYVLERNAFHPQRTLRSSLDRKETVKQTLEITIWLMIELKWNKMIADP